MSVVIRTNTGEVCFSAHVLTLYHNSEARKAET